MSWFDNNHEAIVPADADERTAYLADLAHEAEHGPSDDTNDPQGVKQ